MASNPTNAPVPVPRLTQTQLDVRIWPQHAAIEADRMLTSQALEFQLRPRFRWTAMRVTTGTTSVLVCPSLSDRYTRYESC